MSRVSAVPTSPSAPSAITARGRSIRIDWPGGPASTSCARRRRPRSRRSSGAACCRRCGASPRRRRCSAWRWRAGSCASGARAAPSRARACRDGCAAHSSGSDRRTSSSARSCRRGRASFRAELVDEFKRCRDQVPAEPFPVVRRVVEEDFGKPLAQVFTSFDETPIAAASIAQVHAARLPGGEEVVVKVQRPQRRASWCAATSRPWRGSRRCWSGASRWRRSANPPALVELFAETIVEELDFRLEAQNMLDVARVLHEAGQTIIVVPRPHPELVTRRVLVMERLRRVQVRGRRGHARAPASTPTSWCARC